MRRPAVYRKWQNALYPTQHQRSGLFSLLPPPFRRRTPRYLRLRFPFASAALVSLASLGFCSCSFRSWSYTNTKVLTRLLARVKLGHHLVGSHRPGAGFRRAFRFRLRHRSSSWRIRPFSLGAHTLLKNKMRNCSWFQLHMSLSGRSPSRP